MRKKLKRPAWDINAAYHRFSLQRQIGGVTTRIENGIKITVCPPAYAYGAYPQRSVGGNG